MVKIRGFVRAAMEVIINIWVGRVLAGCLVVDDNLVELNLGIGDLVKRPA